MRSRARSPSPDQPQCEPDRMRGGTPTYSPLVRGRATLAALALASLSSGFAKAVQKGVQFTFGVSFADRWLLRNS